jgi:hypothetical protein
LASTGVQGSIAIAKIAAARMAKVFIAASVVPYIFPHQKVAFREEVP